MYCHQCGAKNAPKQKVCAKCGARLLTAEERQVLLEVAAGAEAVQQPGMAAHRRGETLSSQDDKTGAKGKTSGAGRAFLWLIPLLLAGSVGLALTMYYNYEQSLNREVTALQQRAQKEALAGHYSSAVQLLEEAEGKRPRYTALRQDRELTAKAAELQLQLEKASGQLKEQKLDAGEKALNHIANMVNKRQEPLFAPLKKQLAAGQVKLAVLKVKSELDKLNTVDALAEKLDTVSGLSGQEAAAVKAQIIGKIVGISYAAAERKLRDKDFVGAMAEVDSGLLYAADNKKLIAYRKQIADAKKEFERAEAERIQLAEQKAAEEDLNNRTAAVDVSGLHVVLDDYGDLQISGTVTNKATRPIYSVSINLDIYDSSGSYLGNTYAGVSPYHLEPGETGDFTTWYYGVYSQAQASVVNATWYLE
ncbi:FxLYD domain-containing protein [Paenibacillus sophorae]|uniref:FxLYD domain-containing protein n=1 Tax=Paenibacillus sophorae TaxID=1333845 RepID=A0ABX8HH47_9BACL|nr:FxLYD domain-containing protein [Paenibacillus sophorae]QWU17016.1 FxLYD domain-containing protein [Paenibacillus sophorae]